MQRYEKLENIVTPVLESMGYDLVRLMIHREGSRKVLQVMIERKDEVAITVDDCEKVSRELSAILDVEDPIEGKYSLEISSAGLDRPLTKLVDFIRFNGFFAKIETDVPISGQKRFKGKITGISEADEILLLPEGKKEDIALPFSAIAKAKLIVTDEMLKSPNQ